MKLIHLRLVFEIPCQSHSSEEFTLRQKKRIQSYTPRADQIPISGSKSFWLDRSLICRDLRELDRVSCVGSVRSSSYTHACLLGGICTV